MTIWQHIVWLGLVILAIGTGLFLLAMVLEQTDKYHD